MAKKPTDITGQRFCRLTVIGIAGKTKDGRIVWDCVCDCGKHIIAKYSDLRRGKTKSCGCLKAETTSMVRRTHGESWSKLWRIWVAMRRRCHDKNNKYYKDYGGRGIKVCELWDNDYSAFREWALSNGYNENAEYMQCTIDRINVNGDYCPENCRWVDIKTQANNTRRNRNITYNGETHNLKQWSEILGLRYGLLLSRITRLNWSIEEAFTTPVGTHRSKTLIVEGDN